MNTSTVEVKLTQAEALLFNEFIVSFMIQPTFKKLPEEQQRALLKIYAKVEVIIESDLRNPAYEQRIEQAKKEVLGKAQSDEYSC